MSQNPVGPRRYTDEEVRRLLERASELESQGATLPAKVEGPTLRDLEAIASEAGINPSAVRRAAEELEGTAVPVPAPGHRGSELLGGPLQVELEREVAGEVPNDVLESMLPVIQRAAEGVGHPSLVGRTLTWQSEDPSKTRILQVSVRAGRGRTRIVISERYGNLAAALFGGIVGGVGGGVGLGVGLGVGIGALGSALFATVFPLAVFSGSYLIARTSFKGVVRGRLRFLSRLMDDLVATAEDGLPLASDQED